MTTLSIDRTIDSDSVTLTGLGRYLGKSAHIVIEIDEPSSLVDNSKTVSPYDDFFGLAGQDVIDAELIEKYHRANSL